MRKLTEKQQKFLDVLFEEARGSMVEAKKLAGYSPTQHTAGIVESLKDEILERTNMYLAQSAPRAAMAMVGALRDPTELGIKEKMQVETTGGVMILPPKREEENDSQQING